MLLLCSMKAPAPWQSRHPYDTATKFNETRSILIYIQAFLTKVCAVTSGITMQKVANATLIHRCNALQHEYIYLNPIAPASLRASALATPLSPPGRRVGCQGNLLALLELCKHTYMRLIQACRELCSSGRKHLLSNVRALQCPQNNGYKILLYEIFFRLWQFNILSRFAEIGIIDSLRASPPSELLQANNS